MSKSSEIQYLLQYNEYLQVLSRNILDSDNQLYNSIRALVSKLLTISELIKALDFAAMNQANITALSSELEACHISLSEIDVFPELITSDEEEIAKLERPLKDFENNYAAIVNRIAPWIVIINTDKAISTSVSHIMRFVDETEKRGREYTEQWESTHKQILDIEDVIKKKKEEVEAFTENITVARYQNLYMTQADSHRIAANLWLFATILIIAIIAGGSALMLANETQLAFLQSDKFSVIATRVIIYTALFLLLSICSKNYRANRHNQIVNKHRNNALSSFITFIQSSSEYAPEVKGQILLEVTRTIFSNQATGYAPTENDDSTNTVFEVFKNFPGSKAP